MRRGLAQHDLLDLIHDVFRMGIISHAEFIGTIMGKTVGGTVVEDVTRKYVSALSGARSSSNLVLASERA